MRPLYSDQDLERERRIPGESPEAVDKNGKSYRSPYRRDYARVLHSPSFRRLQGKTQLFPGSESDFFRNRLTHSLEVAQIAKSIALRLNCFDEYFSQKGNHIDLDLVETAALAHDLGHPPFGHNGERALDHCMKDKGGFEGNAQSLRILARSEWREHAGPDRERIGLNLTYRTLAAVLKYDKCIPVKRLENKPLVKGYYDSEKELVAKIKTSVLGPNFDKGESFKTVECRIMDLADDIAYSTYDVEDALKAGFISPITMISAMLDDKILKPIKKKLGHKERNRTVKYLLKHIMDIWLEPMFNPSSLELDVNKIDIRDGTHLAVLAAYLQKKAQMFNENGSVRTSFTSELVNEYVDGVQAVVNKETPALSTVELRPDLKKRVEVLKHLTYALIIQAPSLQTVEYRGYGIVKEIFEALSGKGGELLLPEDYRRLIDGMTDQLEKDRTICDFVAGMTDRYALEFYGRLHSESAQTIFKPL